MKVEFDSVGRCSPLFMSEVRTGEINWRAIYQSLVSWCLLFPTSCPLLSLFHPLPFQFHHIISSLTRPRSDRRRDQQPPWLVPHQNQRPARPLSRDFQRHGGFEWVGLRGGVSVRRTTSMLSHMLSTMPLFFLWRSFFIPFSLSPAPAPLRICVRLLTCCMGFSVCYDRCFARLRKATTPFGWSSFTATGKLMKKKLERRK